MKHSCSKFELVKATSWTGSVSDNYVQALKTFLLPLFSCCPEPYKLVSLNTTKRYQEISACRKTCWKYGMHLMPLDSDEDRKAIVTLPGYTFSSLVITDGIYIVNNPGSSTFFSSPGGRQVNFIHLASTIGKWNSPGTHNIVIYHHNYYSRDSVVDKNDKCACKLGEWCLYNRHADFDANKKCKNSNEKCRRETRPAQYLATSAWKKHSCSNFALDRKC